MMISPALVYQQTIKLLLPSSRKIVWQTLRLGFSMLQHLQVVFGVQRPIHYLCSLYFQVFPSHLNKEWSHYFLTLSKSCPKESLLNVAKYKKENNHIRGSTRLLLVKYELSQIYENIKTKRNIFSYRKFIFMFRCQDFNIMDVLSYL